MKKILISKCLTGEDVRWNGKSKKSCSIILWLESQGFDVIPVCPEDDLFGTPRPPIRLIKIDDRIEAVKAGQDVSEELERRCREITSDPEIVGFVGVSKSPTCGIGVGVKNLGRVIKGYMHKLSSFPTVESGQLRTQEQKEAFLKRIRKYEEQSLLR